MTTERVLLNPDIELPKDIVERMLRYRKVKPVWAKKLTEETEIVTLEGREIAHAGDFLCRGIRNELWPQQESSLLAKYQPTEVFDDDLFQRFDPKPDITPVDATPIDYPFWINSRWGEMTGKSGDFVVKSSVDAGDIWIVDHEIFQLSYELVKPNG